MSDKDIIKKAFDAAEQEHQEKEISKIKQIVQSYLEKIQSKAEQKDKLDEEIRLLKKDLDDLKSGRLDRIKERQDKDERAREVSIIIVKEIREKMVPYYPWRSPWIIEYRYPNQTYYHSSDGNIMLASSSTYQTSSTPTISLSSSSSTQASSGPIDMMNQMVEDMNNLHMTITGQTLSNFVGGAYKVNDKIINL